MSLSRLRTSSTTRKQLFFNLFIPTLVFHIFTQRLSVPWYSDCRAGRCAVVRHLLFVNHTCLLLMFSNIPPNAAAEGGSDARAVRPSTCGTWRRWLLTSGEQMSLIMGDNGSENTPACTRRDNSKDKMWDQQSKCLSCKKRKQIVVLFKKTKVTRLKLEIFS